MRERVITEALRRGGERVDNPNEIYHSVVPGRGWIMWANTNRAETVDGEVALSTPMITVADSELQVRGRLGDTRVVNGPGDYDNDGRFEVTLRIEGVGSEGSNIWVIIRLLEEHNEIIGVVKVVQTAQSRTKWIIRSFLERDEQLGTEAVVIREVMWSKSPTGQLYLARGLDIGRFTLVGRGGCISTKEKVDPQVIWWGCHDGLPLRIRQDEAIDSLVDSLQLGHDG